MGIEMIGVISSSRRVGLRSCLKVEVEGSISKRTPRGGLQNDVPAVGIGEEKHLKGRCEA
jgi:hypothetical protein